MYVHMFFDIQVFYATGGGGYYHPTFANLICHLIIICSTSMTVSFVLALKLCLTERYILLVTVGYNY